MDGFWSSRCLNDSIDLPDKIGSYLSGAATLMVVKNGTKKLSKQNITKMTSKPFEELQGGSSELKLITPTSITSSHFGTMAAILVFLLSTSQLLEELQG